MRFGDGSVRIGTKIFALIAALGAVAIGVAGVGYSTLQAYDQAVDDVQVASRRALYSERLNRLVTSVVMDARGIYAADDAATAKKFGEGVMASLGQIDELLKAWAPIVPAQDQALFDAVSRDAATFRAFRTETVRLGSQESPAAANAQGNNDGNRANRRAFQASIDAMTERGRAEVKAVDEQVASLYAERLALLLILSLGGTLAAIVVGGLIVQRQIARPLAGVTGAIQRLAAGDHRLPDVKPGKDEVGDIWRSMQVFAGAMQEAASLREAQAETDKRRIVERRSEMTGLAGRFEGSVGELVQHLAAAAQEMEATSRSLAANAEQTTRQSSSVLTIASDASNNVQAVAAATEELAASAREIGAQVELTSQAAANAVENVRHAHERVDLLARGAQKIGEFVKLIQDIAGQTNLLALNATIEAARAGEAGRGFAVVAAEVKELAGQTARATDEITAQISSIQGATEETVKAIEEIAGIIAEVHHIASGVSAAVEEQQAATQEIARNISEAARGTLRVSEDVAEMQMAANEAGHGASQVRSAAGELAVQSTRLGKEVDGFLSGVRAA
nr:methyl-accepting chemotaxis protein [Methylopila capsulata]